MSPVSIRKKDGYQVSTPGGVKAKSTTLAKAQAQRRLLYGVESGEWKPTGKPARKSRNTYRDALMGGSSEVTRIAKRRGRR